MQRTHHQYVTKQQLQRLYEAWNTDAEVPKKGMKAIIAWPMKESAEVHWTDERNDVGARLYRITFYRH